jgi:virginiamycin B lyase
MLGVMLLAACDTSDASDASRTGEATATGAAASGESLDSVRITEWDVPWPDTRPRDPDVAPDGRVWFVGQVGNYVAVLDPRSGEFQRYALADGVLPHNLIVGGDGTVWYAGNHAAHIGRMNPRDGAVRVIDMPDSAAFDPHTLVFGASGEIWFTVQQSAYVGRLDPGSERVELRKMPAGSRPYGVIADPSGGAWAVLFGRNRIVRIEPDLTIRDYDLPSANARPRRLVRTSDGAIWYVDHARGTIGRLDPSSGAVREVAAPGGVGARPYAMAVDDRDRLWFVETGSEPNRFVGFDPSSESFIANSPVPSGGGSVRHMVFHRPTRSIWFGTDANTIGRAELPS